MQIIRDVQIKYVVTEDLKAELSREAKRARQGLDTRIQQIDVEGRRVVERIQRENVVQAGQIREQIEQEKQQLLQYRREVEQRSREIDGLQIGDEIVRGRTQALDEVKEGDSVDKLLGSLEVVVKAGVIVEIREAKPEEEDEAEAGDNVVQGPTILTPS